MLFSFFSFYRIILLKLKHISVSSSLGRGSFSFLLHINASLVSYSRSTQCKLENAGQHNLFDINTMQLYI